LIGKGDGICNAIYIDNLIDLILLAMKSDDAIGQAFIGAEGRGVTWSAFYGAYARMLGVSHLRSLPYAAVLAIATASELFSRITGRAPIVSRKRLTFMLGVSASRNRVSGYEPQVSLCRA
jgi:nucleoside-diphosphate-sugar epimerase